MWINIQFNNSKIIEQNSEHYRETALMGETARTQMLLIGQGFSKFTFKGPNGNYHQRQKVRNNCYYKTCFYKHAYYFI